MMADICARGFSRHADYGTWVFVDGLAPAGTCPEKKAVTRKVRSGDGRARARARTERRNT